ncbi:homolog to NAD kinase [Natrialba magadii ATCC 43099]|uniref:ATP-NAD/AcoX kinase n=1 Tax=Natrialba magadii (strain ATCC 43099 / DSM 3394 / CCM 3739 / CIP 104546 / IAM 13178 / JCM 8861 / NBRC 102185 / NCIMB 2190 / MS3) TaxID=547559 RepID=D3SXE9_NATMM|nr:ATP-NAD kinase family protein [Natrialba magadii]ADD05898.1 homolog to NAD kinase [Natrialba magadii ATCC 43099]ELY30595.1 ATP-NAD/AcoX kinase [Natrialba magadii ATCC 43099]
MDALGVVVNPIAGMGGRVGLKGTDGKLTEARERGAEPRAPERARDALTTFSRHAPDIPVYTAAGIMGEFAARDAGLEPRVVYDPRDEPERVGKSVDTPPDPTVDPADAETTAADTRRAVRALLEAGVDLVLFVGGDGTAVDVAGVLEEQEQAQAQAQEQEQAQAQEQEQEQTPMLGVPAGVKIYSSVFAVTPRDAGRIAAEFDRVESREVNDIDEDAYRAGEVRSELKAVVPVPVAPDVQSSKQLSSGSVDALAAGFAREVEPGRTYVFGPGGTVGEIESELGIEPSPLGVDVWRAGSTDSEVEGDGDTDGHLLASDAAEADILDVLELPATVVVSPIGGQGVIFGRGNHQLSPAVLERADDIVVVADEEKLAEIATLRVDTDDEAVNEELRGWQRVRTGRFTTRLVKVV